MSLDTPTPPPTKKKDKILGFDTEDIALGLGALAVAGVGILGFLKLQDLNVFPKPPGVPQSRVTIGPPPDLGPPPPPVVAAATEAQGGVLERDPLGPNSNSITMDGEYIDQEKLAKTRTVDRINAGY